MFTCELQVHCEIKSCTNSIRRDYHGKQEEILNQIKNDRDLLEKVANSISCNEGCNYGNLVLCLNPFDQVVEEAIREFFWKEVFETQKEIAKPVPQGYMPK